MHLTQHERTVFGHKVSTQGAPMGRVARRCLEQQALAWEGSRLSGPLLMDSALRLAKGLRMRGAWRQDRIAKLALNGPGCAMGSAVLSRPVVLDVAVVDVALAQWSEAGKVLVVCLPGQSRTAPELIAHSNALITGHECPKQVEVLTDLPRVLSGQVNQVALCPCHRFPIPERQLI